MADISISPDEFSDLDSLLPEGVAPDQSGPTAQTIFNTPDDGVDEMLKPGADLRSPEEKAADTEKDRLAKEALEELDEDVNGPADADQPDATTGKAGRPRTDKSGIVEVGKKLMELGIIEDFEEEVDEKGVVKPNKPIEDYTVSDWVELLKGNVENKVNAVKEQTPKEFFEALPQELQYATKYVQDGGTDIKGLFKVLGEVEEVRQLDPKKAGDQEAIIRSYLQATDFGDAGEIEEQITDYKAAGTLGKWAEKHKPKLDQLGQAQVEQRLAQQETIKKNIQLRRDAFHKTTYEALKPAEIAGSKIDNKTQEKLYNDLTQLTYQSLSGRPTTKLSHDFERLQFGEAPNMALMAEVSWLMSDPDGYKKHVAGAAVKDVVVDTARRIKTTQASKTASGTGGDVDENNTRETARKGVSRPARNIFSQ